MSDTTDKEKVEKDFELFKQWAAEQPTLPKDLGDKLLFRFLHSCYYDLEKAKAAVQLFCSIRASSTLAPILDNRDPSSEHMKKTFSIVNLAQLKISGNRNLWIWQLNDPGLEKYDYAQDARVFFLSTDSWLLNEQELEESDVVLMDVKDISLKFVTKFNISIARKISNYQEGAMPIRLKQVHVVNTPPVIDKIYGLMKPMLQSRITEMIRFHPPKSSKLFEYFEKDDLPEDYGGTRGKMADHMVGVMEEINANRDKLINDKLWKAIDVKKSKKNKAEVQEVQFRNLAID